MRSPNRRTKNTRTKSCTETSFGIIPENTEQGFRDARRNIPPAVQHHAVGKCRWHDGHAGESGSRGIWRLDGDCFGLCHQLVLWFGCLICLVGHPATLKNPGFRKSWWEPCSGHVPVIFRHGADQGARMDSCHHRLLRWRCRCRWHFSLVALGGV